MDSNLSKEYEPNKDLITDYGKNLAPSIDPRTDYGKGISFKSVDGREWSTIEQAEAANRDYYEAQLIKHQNSIDEVPTHHR